MVRDSLHWNIEDVIRCNPLQMRKWVGLFSRRTVKGFRACTTVSTKSKKACVYGSHILNTSDINML